MYQLPTILAAWLMMVAVGAPVSADDASGGGAPEPTSQADRPPDRPPDGPPDGPPDAPPDDPPGPPDAAEPTEPEQAEEPEPEESTESDPTEEPDDSVTPVVPWGEVSDLERETLLHLLEAAHWPTRAFGILRLQRYEGEAVDAMIRQRLADEAWQIRCFALDEALRRGMEIDPAAFADEVDPRVTRALLRAGMSVKAARLRRAALRLLEARSVDEVLLGIELAAFSDDPSLHKAAAPRLSRLIMNMDDAVAQVVGHRLAALFGLEEPLSSANAWREWVMERAGALSFATLGEQMRERDREPSPPDAVIATYEREGFIHLLDYMDGLKQRNLDLVIVMDATGSMRPMIDQTRASVDRLITFLGDITQSMRLAFVVFDGRSEDPPVDGIAFTTDVQAVRRFLFNVKNDPARTNMLAGLRACTQLRWKRGTEKQIIIIGDDNPPPADVPAMGELLASCREQRITVHTVLVGGARYAADAFAEIAKAGLGQTMQLTHSDRLVAALVRLTLEKPWWPIFDDFYARYERLCR